MSDEKSAGSYAWILPFLPRSISGIVEIGSRDALDAIELSNYFQCPVVAFEADPHQLEVCLRNVALSGAEVTVRPEALSDVDGQGTLWQVDRDLYQNDGVSSLFEIDFSNRPDTDPDRHRSRIQKPITIEMARWDSLALDSPSLVVMDVEGAELNVLRGFGDRLRQVEYVALEVHPHPTHRGGASFRDIHRFLLHAGFEFLAMDRLGRGFLRLKVYVAVSRLRSRLRHPLGARRTIGFFNVLYRNRSL